MLCLAVGGYRQSILYCEGGPVQIPGTTCDALQFFYGTERVENSSTMEHMDIGKCCCKRWPVGASVCHEMDSQPPPAPACKCESNFNLLVVDYCMLFLIVCDVPWKEPLNKMYYWCHALPFLEMTRPPDVRTWHFWYDRKIRVSC